MSVHIRVVDGTAAAHAAAAVEALCPAAAAEPVSPCARREMAAAAARIRRGPAPRAGLEAVEKAARRGVAAVAAAARSPWRRERPLWAAAAAALSTWQRRRGAGVTVVVVDDPGTYRWGLPHTACDVIVWPAAHAPRACVFAHEFVHVLQRAAPQPFREAYLAEGRWRALEGGALAAEDGGRCWCGVSNPDTWEFPGAWARYVEELDAWASARLVAVPIAAEGRTASDGVHVLWTTVDGRRRALLDEMRDYHPHEDAAERMAREACRRYGKSGDE